jgi:uncharacterized delta-60 repeat protein
VAYVELAAGLHFRNESGEWQESDPAFELTSDGYAVARRGQHQVIVSPNLNSAEGVIDMQTPDGKRLRSGIIGLNLFDPVSGKSLQVSSVRSVVGTQISPTEIIWFDAFEGLKADVRVRNERGTFHQDVLLREKLSNEQLAALGFDPETVRIEVWTEFLEAPAPGISTRVIKTETNATRRAAMAEPDQVDQRVELGMMRMEFGSGRAFAEPGPDKSARISKEWKEIDRERFLIESINYAELMPLLRALPVKTAALNSDSSPTRIALNRIRPQRSAQAGKTESNVIKVAKLDRGAASYPVVVLDYEQINPGTLNNYTFYGDKTYYISGSVILGGTTTTIEGGTVIKYNNTASASIYVNTAVACLTEAYRPATFTSKFDSTIGENVATGTPATYGGYALYFGNLGPEVVLANMRFAYANIGVEMGSDQGQVVTLRNVQFVNCSTPVRLGGYYDYPRVNIYNGLIHNATTAFHVWYGGDVTAQHLTVNSCGTLVLGEEIQEGGSSLDFVNSVFGNVTTILSGDSGVFGGYNGFDNNSPTFGTPYWQTGTPFQTVGAGSYYLAGSTFRNVGTTAINADLASALKKKTTYPPIEITANITTATTWAPQATRDTDTPDLGWHYDALDYVAYQKTVSASLTLNNGLVVGTYGPLGFFGLPLMSGGSLTSKGTPANLNWIVRYNTVQEQSTTAWSASTVGSSIGTLSGTPSVAVAFTAFSVPAGVGEHFNDELDGVVVPSFSHCQFFGGNFTINPGSASLANCLWHRVYVTLKDDDDPSEWHLFNNLFYGGTLYYRARGDNPVMEAYDNFFDKTTITKGTSSEYFTHNYNGYINGQNRLTPNAANDVLVPSSTYASGALGSFYQASNDLWNKGSRTAPTAGLFHYTTKATQAKEGVSQVDIGFHYAALDGNLSTSQPLDADGDSIADYLEDINGNGIVNAGEGAWFNTAGAWNTPFPFGYVNQDFHIRAIHASLLPTGKVLFYEHHAPAVYDPNASQNWTTPTEHASFHMFCTGHTLMSDGNLFVAGGHIGTPAGLRHTAVYSPTDDFWTRLPRMNEGRWYPTCTTLDSGEILITTGSYASGNLQLPIDNNRITQVWSPAPGQFRNLTGASRNIALDPFIFTVPNGGVFHAGPSLGQVFYPGPQTPDTGETVRTTRKLTTAGTGSWGAMYEPISTHEPFGSAVMYRSGKVLLAGGISPVSGRHVVADAEAIDLTQGSPSWASVGAMTYARHQHNMTILPDGTVLVTGGHNSTDLDPWPTSDRVSPFNVRTPELWAPNPQNPTQWIWTSLADCPSYRGYHSVALLLPDGRVLSTGGNFFYPFGAQNAVADAEIFSPPYLSKGARPVISSAPSVVAYGQSFTVQTPVAEEVSSVTFLRLGSVTHSFNMNQRFLSLTFSGGNGSWNVTAPSLSTECPPGHYLLYVINTVGVPSVAKIVQILPLTDPEIIMACPANGGFVEPGNLKLSARVKNPGANQTVKFYYRDDFGGPSQFITETAAPYSITWAQNVEGRYHLKARKVGPDVDSPEITVTVNVFPTLNSFLVSPDAEMETIGSETLKAYFRFPVTISRSADDADGISRMELYAERAGTTLLLTGVNNSSSISFDYTWPYARSGTPLLSCLARDIQGIESVLGQSALFRLYGGALDTTFATGDGANDSVQSIAVQSDGKMLIAGAFTTFDGTSRNGIARLNADGTLDSSFLNSMAGANGVVNTVGLQTDGKILIGGDFNSVNGQTRNRIARLNSNGTLDSFNPSSDGAVNVILIQTDGKILVGGTFALLGGATRNRIARLNSDGTLDSFNPNADGNVTAVAVQSDGKIVIVGTFMSVAGVTRQRIARINGDGTLDNNFSPSSDGTINAVAIQSDGQILIGGSFTAVNGSARNRIARLSASGALDANFNPGVSSEAVPDNSVVYSVAVQSDGKVLLGGDFTKITATDRKRIGRLHTNGVLDDSFRPSKAADASGYGPNNNVRSVAIMPNGMIVIGGDFTAYPVQVPPPPFPQEPGVRRGIARIGGL